MNQPKERSALSTTSSNGDKPETASTEASAVALPDIKPVTPVSKLDRGLFTSRAERFPIGLVAPAVGMSREFIRRAVGRKVDLSVDDVLELLDQDAYQETFCRRSQVLTYLLRQLSTPVPEPSDLQLPDDFSLLQGDATALLSRLPRQSIDCVVTSTPYWGMRIYEDPTFVEWADGERCPYGHEQTPEGFLRHTTELLYLLQVRLKPSASIWWNVMDTFNTRTQIRGNASEALRAMQGLDARKWHEHASRRYSAGHSFLLDGEQSLIPSRIAERASRIGYYVKTVITWSKKHTTPEPQKSRVSRSLEYILHLSPVRTPKFDKDAYRRLPVEAGGRNGARETDKLADVWSFGTSSGGNGHGAQFPLALPARCISLSTGEGDVVLDPFVGAGTSGVAARMLNRRFLGFDVSHKYLTIAKEKISSTSPGQFSEAIAAAAEVKELL